MCAASTSRLCKATALACFVLSVNRIEEVFWICITTSRLISADQIYGDEEMHHDVRRLCMDYIGTNRDHFSQFITEDFNEYLERKRNVDVHGNHVELQAVSEIFMRPIEIYEYSTGRCFLHQQFFEAQSHICRAN